MQHQSSFPLPQPLDSPQPPSERDIKKNLQKYSPFYRQAMHFNGEGVETLFYVAHNNFSSEKALKKLEAFGLFKEKKIVFVEFQRSEDRLRDPPAGGLPAIADNRDGSGTIEALRAVAVYVNGNPSAHQNGPGDHFTVKVKMPVSPDSPVIPDSPDSLDSYKLEELIIYGDGKCGIVASIVALREICKDYNAPIEGPPILPAGDSSTVELDQDDPYNELLRKENKKEVIYYKVGGQRYGDEKLHYHVAKDLALVRNSDWFSSLEVSLQERVSALLDNTTDTHLLSPKKVHAIISTNVEKLKSEQSKSVANISPQHIHAVSSEETLLRGGAVAVIPPSVLKGEKKEGIELRKDAKHEFRIIVLNILHEWIDTERPDFSKINEDDFLESLIKEKLGNECAQKIKTELGGEITFKSLLAIDEVGAGVGDENLKKERETFYSAQFSFDAVAQEDGVSENPSNKVWGRIKDIVDKYNSTEVFQTTNPDFITSFKGALKKIKEIPTVDKGSIDSTLLGFDDKIEKITGVAPPAAAQPAGDFLVQPPSSRLDPAQPDLPGHDDARLDLPALAPTADPHKVGVHDSLGQLGGLMETALGVIGKAFEDLGKGITISCEEARKNLLEKVKEMEEMTKKPGNAPVNQDNKQTSEIPDNNILKPIFYALRSCLGEERK